MGTETTTGTGTTLLTPEQVSAKLVLSRGYRTIWLSIVLLSIVWTWVAALSIIGGVGVTPSTAVFGIGACITFALTAFVAGRPKGLTPRTSGTSSTLGTPRIPQGEKN